MRKKSLFKRVYRTLGFVTLGGIVTVLLFTTNETYSLFSKSLQEQLQVASASAENLVTNVEILEHQDGSQLIQITRDSEYGYRPDVGFVIEGELANYILHINPVTIDKNGVYEIPIEPNLNTYQFLDLLRMKYSQQKSHIPGGVTVKNFDGKIIDSKEIEISIDYLVSKIGTPITRSNSKERQYIQMDDFAIANVTNLLTTIAGQFDWEDDMIYAMAMAPTDTLTPHQKEIIRTIAPHLIGGVDALYYELESIKQENAELKLEIENLNKIPINPEPEVPENPETTDSKPEVPQNPKPKEPQPDVPKNPNPKDPKPEVPESPNPKDPKPEVPENLEPKDPQPEVPENPESKDPEPEVPENPDFED